MPFHSPVPIDYEPYAGDSDVFAASASSLKDLRAPFRKRTSPKDPTRQEHFERLVLLLAHEFGRQVPTFVNWNGRTINRMDKGCIGHSMAGPHPLIVSFEQNERGTVTHINLRAS